MPGYPCCCNQGCTFALTWTATNHECRTVCFTASVGGADLTGCTATWAFGDGKTKSGDASELLEVCHVYPDTSRYTASLTISCSSGTCIYADFVNPTEAILDCKCYPRQSCPSPSFVKVTLTHTISNGDCNDCLIETEFLVPVDPNVPCQGYLSRILDCYGYCDDGSKRPIFSIEWRIESDGWFEVNVGISVPNTTDDCDPATLGQRSFASFRKKFSISVGNGCIDGTHALTRYSSLVGDICLGEFTGCTAEIIYG